MHLKVLTYTILQANFPHKDVYKESVEIFLERSLNGDPGYPKQGSFQHLHASCPCQGVSKANRAKNGGKNGFDNNYKMYLFLEVVKLLKPLTISFENVTGLLDEPKCDFLREIIATLLHELNYHVRVCVLCAADYGDPQQRDRVFLFASKREIPLALEPVKTHDSNIQTVRESIGDLENINPQPGSGRVVLRNGKVIQNHTCEGTEKNNKGLEKLIPDKPAPTLYGNSTNTMLHYTHNRCLTTRELARLMSFPDSHKFPSKRNVARSLIYNAVPVHLATAVAKSIMDACYTRDYSHEDQSAVSKCKKPSK